MAEKVKRLSDVIEHREDLDHINITRDFQEAMFNYLVYGFEPGGHFTALLANDLFRAVQNCHPSIQSLIADHTKWILWYAPMECYGSYDIVRDWSMDKNRARSNFVRKAEKKYIWKTLKE